MTRERFEAGTVLDCVAVFPLPQVVLFPGALMPLHIFEPRYRAMTRDLLATTRLLAVTQIPEHHGVDAFGQPEIAEICGVGEIVRHDVLPDGRFNILVQGLSRVRLEELPLERPYRRARLTVLGTRAGTLQGSDVRALTSAASSFAAQVRKSHPEFSFEIPADLTAGELSDLCAHYLVLDGGERQHLLETLDDGERVRRVLEALLEQHHASAPDDRTIH